MVDREVRSSVHRRTCTAAVNDVELVPDAHGHPGAPALLLHGGEQTRHSWDTTAETLSDAAAVVEFLIRVSHARV